MVQSCWICEPDVLLANSTPAAVAVRDTTRATPTVFVQVTDTIAAGLVESFAAQPEAISLGS